MAAAIIEVGSLILSGVELAVGAAKVAKEVIPTPPSGLTDKHRWILCTVKNQTQFDVVLNNTHFDSGRYWDAPGNIPPFAQMAFSCCNGDNTFLTGVSGGNQFQVMVDENTPYKIALGWTNPQSGSNKAGAKEEGSAQDGYNAATREGNTFTSTKKFRGKDKETNAPTDIQFHVSASPGQNFMFVISQIRC